MKQSIQFVVILLLGILAGTLASAWYFNAVVQDMAQVIREDAILSRYDAAEAADATQSFPIAEFEWLQLLALLDAQTNQPFGRPQALNQYYLIAHGRLANLYDAQGMDEQSLHHIAASMTYMPEKVRAAMESDLPVIGK